MNMLAVTHVTVATTSKTLAQLGVTIDANLARLALFPAGTVTHAFNGEASATTSGPVPLEGLSMPIDATAAALLQFAANNVPMTVQQYG